MFLGDTSLSTPTTTPNSILTINFPIILHLDHHYKPTENKNRHYPLFTSILRAFSHPTTRHNNIAITLQQYHQ